MKSLAESAVERVNPLAGAGGGGVQKASLSRAPVTETQEQCVTTTSHQEFKPKQQQQHKAILPLREHPTLCHVSPGT